MMINSPPSVIRSNTINFTRILSNENSKYLSRENSINQNYNSYNSIRNLKLKGNVGFDRIADQVVSKSVKHGFAFNILCIGETGIGKSTLMDTLFNTDFDLKPSDHNEERVTLNSNTFELCENKVRLKLTIIETCGFGDQINKENSHEEILKYINDQFETYVQQELALKRDFKQAEDTRVHLCLYFICPTGHSLKAIDLNTMKALDRKVNIIPIIAKADTISKNELIEFKKRIMCELNNNHVNIYNFPINDFDLNISNQNATANGLFPLAVVGSSEMVKIGNNTIRGRRYEWGTVSCENELHCDFLKLRQMILKENMMDLIEMTHVKHYQLYRSNRLKEIGFIDEDDVYQSDCSSGLKARTIQDVYNIKRAELEEEIHRKELEIKEEFTRRVKEKDLQIKEREKELENRFMKLKKKQKEWADRIDQKRRDLEEEMREFSERKFTLEKSKLSTITSFGKNSRKK